METENLQYWEALASWLRNKSLQPDTLALLSGHHLMGEKPATAQGSEVWSQGEASGDGRLSGAAL